MLSFLVILFVGFITFLMIQQKKEENRLLLLIIGLFCIPASAVAFSKSPYLDPKSILLYLYIITSYVNDPSEFKRSIRDFPFKIPCFIVLVFFVITAYFGADGSAKRIYDSVRIYIDSYGFLFAAFCAGRKADFHVFYKNFFKLVFLLCTLGVIEHFIHDNIPYKIICSAFPYYDGFADLNGTVTFDQDWRTRINILTKHPTALGTMLCICILTIIPLARKDISKEKKLLFAGLILVTVYYSGSRTALLCALFFSLYYFVSKKSKFFKLVLLVSLIIAASNITKDFIENLTTKGQGSSLELRQDQLLYSYMQFRNSPYFGNGLGYIEKYLIEEDKNGRAQVENLGGLESVVFSLLINQGIFGLVSYFFMLGWIMVFFKRKANQGKIAGDQGFLVTSCCTLFFILSGHIGSNDIMCYTFIGLLAGNSLSTEDEPSEEPDKDVHNADEAIPQQK